jgi:hypothetical protein
VIWGFEMDDDGQATAVKLHVTRTRTKASGITWSAAPASVHRLEQRALDVARFRDRQNLRMVERLPA